MSVVGLDSAYSLSVLFVCCAEDFAEEESAMCVCAVSCRSRGVGSIGVGGVGRAGGPARVLYSF